MRRTETGSCFPSGEVSREELAEVDLRVDVAPCLGTGIGIQPGRDSAPASGKEKESYSVPQVGKRDRIELICGSVCELKLGREGLGPGSDGRV